MDLRIRRIAWHRSRCEEIVIRCPNCGHQIGPPEYPYCSHTVFVYVEPAINDAIFVFMRADFAVAWKMVRAKKPSRKVIGKFDLCESIEVLDVTEYSGYYPTRVVAGFEKQERHASAAPPEAGGA